MNILLINHYAGSPKMGMEYRPYYLSREWIRNGNNITILAADHSHVRTNPPEVQKDFEEQWIDGILYVWVKTPDYRGNGISRTRNMFMFTWKSFAKARQIAQKYRPDVVIASSTYPSDNYVARKIARFSGAKYLYEVHDLWPLSPMELGSMSKYHPFIIAMQHAEDFACRNADAVVSMLPKTLEYLNSRGMGKEKWHYIPNGIVISEWKEKMPLSPDVKEEIKAIRNKYKNIVAYIGAHGLANALHHYITAATYFKDDSVAFVLVGKGPEKESLIRHANSLGVQNVFFLDSIPKQEVPFLLSEFDFLYIGLQNQPLFRFGISPNKLIDYMMAGKPVIQAINAGNDIVSEASCGISVEAEDPDAIVKALSELIALPKEEKIKMGQNGERYVARNHDYAILAEKFIMLMRS